MKKAESENWVEYHWMQRHRQMVRNECAERGITIGRQGKAFRLVARGIDILVLDLCWISLDDMVPAYKKFAWWW